MQKVVEFKTRNFWSSQLNLDTLNEEVTKYNNQGWRVIQVTPVSSFSAHVRSVLLLLEKSNS
ncbi:DUF4177 domain-containing protein [Alteromonas portus]|uniref:DUF4177 domain-containing protein n=1 Tax=Alteromonas portus TaxID=2565549 RepID=A0A4V5NQS8_9ALTE|nr:DUF4177 domain-containing protein [Alteromonas portus]TKB02176.1 DUF4177 domain-containing protein [Alteromonas portus]|tara:strand:+ start:911 stop:1096 length:186 start_codon:yes stop_codon:yes gene_type:complete